MPTKTKNTKTQTGKLSSGKGLGKFKIFAFVAVFAVIGLATVLLSHAATGDGSIPVYRAYNASVKQHLFTYNGAEANSGAGGLAYEGVAFYAWADGSAGRMPVYRIFVNNTHLFTMSEAEKNAVVANGGHVEGVGWYAYLSGAPGRLPVYRLAGSNGDHMYVTSAGERDAISGPGKAFTYEGIAFYVSDHSVPKNYNTPSGAVDVANCKTISGWAADIDLPDSGVPINVYIEGRGYDLGFTSVPRGDVNAAAHVTGNHGFNMTVPTNWRDGKPHTWVAYALNIDSFRSVIGTNTELKRGEFACDAAGNDLMPQILAQRAEAERQRQAAIAAAAAQAQAQARAAAQSSQGGGGGGAGAGTINTAGMSPEEIAAIINMAAADIRAKQVAAAINAASADIRSRQAAAAIASATRTVNAAISVRNAAASAQGTAVANTVLGAIGAGIGQALNAR